MMETIEACRACRSDRLTTILELGTVPLANALVPEDRLEDTEPAFPLTLLFCESCSLVQIRETVSPEVLFSHYHYASSFSDTMLAHAAQAAKTHIERFTLGPGSFVVEIASNDGYLLKNFVSRGIPALGIDPARNIVELARAGGVDTLCAFFDERVADRVARDRPADLVLANNVVAHVADLRGVIAGVARLLAEEGAAVFEFPYVGDMIADVEFDTIYHEHLCYFSLGAVRALARSHDLEVFDVERLAIHGGSLRVYLGRAGSRPVGPEVAALAAVEEGLGMPRSRFYLDFASEVRRLSARLGDELSRRKGAGQTLAAYGASAKGSTLMNVCGIDRSLLDFVVDRSTVKQGMYTPGNRLPILDPSALVARRPDATLLLTWNFADEIVRQQREYLDGGGVFLVPVPRLRTIGKGEPA